MQTVSTILTICDNAWHLPDIRLYCSLLEAAFLRETIGVVAAVSTNLGKWWQNTHDSHDDVGSTNRLIDSIWLNFGVFFFPELDVVCPDKIQQTAAGLWTFLYKEANKLWTHGTFGGKWHTWTHTDNHKHKHIRYTNYWCVHIYSI